MSDLTQGGFMAKVYTSPIYKLVELNHIFIELTAKNCNQRCKSCYIDFGTHNSLNHGIYKTIKDFIPIEKVKEMIEDTRCENIKCIYLTGAEPMTHPDFNSILRTCLKRANVCICTNASFLNEKKIRFLNKVESEGHNEIFFKLSLTHYDELENDKAKFRGNYRQTIFALKTLSRYNFSSILTIQNIHKIHENILKEAFCEIFKEQEIFNTDLQIISSYPDFEEENFAKPSHKTDCMYGRCLGANGVYTCPFLSNDYRGRVGSSFKNFSHSVVAETDFCATCSKNNNFIFSIS